MINTSHSGEGKTSSVMENFRDYYKLPQVSNSDLSWLNNYMTCKDSISENPLRIGSLIDAYITEPLSLQISENSVRISGLDYEYTQEDLKLAKRMSAAFFQNEFCRKLHHVSDTQTIFFHVRHFFYDNFSFSLECRCKYDFYSRMLGWGADLKSTICTTEKQCREALKNFNYDRQAAWYMDLSDSDQFMIIFVSKINFKVFLIPIKRGDDLYLSGREKYEDLAFHWYILFH